MPVLQPLLGLGGIAVQGEVQHRHPHSSAAAAAYQQCQRCVQATALAATIHVGHTLPVPELAALPWLHADRHGMPAEQHPGQCNAWYLLLGFLKLLA